VRLCSPCMAASISNKSACGSCTNSTRFHMRRGALSCRRLFTRAADSAKAFLLGAKELNAVRLLLSADDAPPACACIALPSSLTSRNAC
jgi:hypothetical protein